MKKRVSAFLIAAFVLSSVQASFGQSRRIRPANVPAIDRVNALPIVSEDPAQSQVSRYDIVDAVSDGNGVLIRWQMQVEVNNTGFNVYRIGALTPELVNDQIVVSESARSHTGVATQSSYELFDPQGSPRTAYLIKCLVLDGSTFDSKTFLPRSVRDLEAEAGRSRESLMATALHLNSEVSSREPDLPAELRDIVDSNLLEPDLPMQQWVASQPGVKIAVRQDGLYRVTRQQLMTAGFDLSGESANWRLFMNGNEHAMIVGAGDQYIEFLGQGLDTRESDTRIYYLLAGDVPGRRITSKIIRPVGGNVLSNNYRYTVRKKERTVFIPNIINGAEENYWGRLIQLSPAAQVQFNVTGLDTSVPRQVLTVRLQGLQGTTHRVKVVLNGHDLGHIGGGFMQNYSEDLLVPSSYFVEGANVLTLNETQTGTNSLFDSVSLRYSRKYQIEQNAVSFYTPGYRRVDLKGFPTSEIRLFDTTLDGSPELISDLEVVPDSGTFTVKVPSARPMVMYAVTEAAILTSTSVTANVPSTLSTASNAADLVIISNSSPEFIAASETWANYRRSAQGGGSTVKVVNIVDVYDEFNYGVQSASAINGFLKYAAANWTTQPRYVLLMGDASWDPRNYEGFGFLDDVPTSMVSLIFEDSGSDEALVDFNHDGVGEMAIGRIPTRSTSAITTVLNKTMAFETPAQQSLDRGALFVHDIPRTYDFLGMTFALADALPESMPKMFVGRGLPFPYQNTPDPQGKANVINAINSGKYIVNYSGHGSTGLWGATDFFGVNDVPSLTNANNESIFTMLTCFNGRFFGPQNESLSEALLKAANGGAVAAWSSTTDTTPDYQLIMGIRFYEQIGIGNIKRMGDLVKDAKTVIAGSDVGYSWVLLGDPMLQVRSGPVQ